MVNIKLYEKVESNVDSI